MPCVRLYMVVSIPYNAPTCTEIYLLTKEVVSNQATKRDSRGPRGWTEAVCAGGRGFREYPPGHRGR
jgi:hypothetical protein